MTLARPVGTVPMPSLTEPLALSNGRVGAGAWFQAALFTLLAWATLLCAGLGGTVVVASQTLANKLAANAQHFQRHGGPALASRALRRDQSAVLSVQQIAEDSRTGILAHAGGALPAGEGTPRVDAQHADEPPPSAAEPRLTPRNRAHPSRAPPVLA